MYQPYSSPLLKKINYKNIDPEISHLFYLLSLHILQNQPDSKIVNRKLYAFDKTLSVKLFGLNFNNPIGLAAGFDKQGLAVKTLSELGFGHIEVGTVTPLPQYGKEKHRFSFLTEDNALINRFGFANDGIEHLKHNLSKEKKRDYILGINIGPNEKSIEEGNAIKDYTICIENLYKYCDYFAINISSPNTKGLRLLHAKKEFDELLASIFKRIKTLRINNPILVKISPDLSEREIHELLDVISSYTVAGIIATNTTLNRPANLISSKKYQLGGLSGKPLKKRSTEIIRIIYKHTKGKLPIIGVGGIFNANDALEKIQAGASLIQLYTGFTYKGPVIIKSINEGIITYLKNNKITEIKELVNT